MGNSSEQTRTGRDREESILRGRLRTPGHALRTKGPGDCERPRAIVTPRLRGSGPTWHRVMLLSSFTHPAQSTGPESNMALSQGCPIEDERSGCGKGPAAMISPKTRPTRWRARSGCRSHPRLNRSCPNTMKIGGEVVIDSHANGSEETRDASCRKGDDDRTARPEIRVKRRDLEGDGRTNS